MNQLPLSQPNQLRQLSQFVATSMPMSALLQSYLVDLRWDPNRPEDPSFAEFDDNILHELGHQVALWGALLRVQQGETAAWSSVGLNLARLLYRRASIKEQAARLQGAQRQDPRVQRLLSLIQEGDRQMEAYIPLMRQTIMATGWQRAAPGLF